MLKRVRHQVPDDVKQAIDQSGARLDFEARPPYQQNDYVGWIIRAKTDETRRKRVEQMIDELKSGGRYMGMKHGPSVKKA